MAPKVVFTTTNSGSPSNLAGVLDFVPAAGGVPTPAAPLPTNGATAACDADGILAAIVSPALAFGGMTVGSGSPVLTLWDISTATPKKLSSLTLPAMGSAGAVAIAGPRIAVALASGFQVGLIDCSNVTSLRFLGWSPMLSLGGLDSVGIASVDDAAGAHCIVYTGSSGGVFGGISGGGTGLGTAGNKVGFAAIDFGTNLANSPIAATFKDNLDPSFPAVLNKFFAASVDAKSGFVAIGQVFQANVNSPTVNSPVVLLRSATSDFAFGAAASQTVLPAVAIGNVAVAGTLTGANPRPIVAISAQPTTNPDQISLIEFNVAGLSTPRVTPVVPSINQPGFAIDAGETTLVAGTMQVGTATTFRIILMDFSGLPNAPIETPVGGVNPMLGAGISTIALGPLRDPIPMILPHSLDLGFAKRPTAADPVATAIPSKTLTLKNDGAQALNLTLTVAAALGGAQAFALKTSAMATPTTAPLTLNIPVGQTKTVLVTLNSPFVLGPAAGSLTVSAGIPFADAQIDLAATVADPTWTIATLPPAAVGPVPTCQTRDLTFTITNTSQVVVVITDISTTAHSAFAVTSPTTLPIRLAPGKLTPDVKLVYTPSGPNAADTAVLSFASDVPIIPASGLTPSVTANLTGSAGPAPVSTPVVQIESAAGRVTIAAGSDTTFADTRARFGRGRRVWVLNADPCAASVPFDLRATIGAISRPAGAPAGAPPEFDVSLDERTLAGLNAGAAGLVASAVGGTQKSFVLVFRPSSAGDFQAPLTLDALDPVAGTVIESLQTTLKGTGFEVTDKVAIDLVLDVSGSMSDVVTTIAGTSVTKLMHLQDAVNLFLGMLIPDEGDHAGLVTFSGTANTLVNAQPFTAASLTQLSAQTSALAAQSSTSIGLGLRQGRDDLDAPPSGLPLARQRMIVMSDGNENFPPPTIEQVITQDGKQLPIVHSIGFGRPADLDDQKLKSMAGRTPLMNPSAPPTTDPATWPTPHGQYRADGDPLELRKLFLFALTDSGRLQTVSDPAGTVTSNQPFLLGAKITDCDSRLFFAVSWENPSDRIELEAVAPDGTVFRNTTLSPGICGRAGQNSMSAWLQLDRIPIDGGGALAPQWAGAWTLRAIGVQLVTNSARCTSIVLVDSSLRLTVNHRQTSATSPLTLALALTNEGAPVSGAAAVVKVTQVGGKAPSTAAALSGLRKAFGTIDGPLNLIDGVIAALTRLTKPATTTQTVQITNGAATLTVPLGPPSRYQVEVTVTGQACGGQFQRYYQFTEVVPPPTSSGGTVTVTPGGTSGIIVVTVVPKSTSGERLGIGRSSSIVPVVRGGDASPVSDRLDGSYRFVVQWTDKFRGKRSLDLYVNGKKQRVPALPKVGGKPTAKKRKRPAR